jgi:hypothetical protein
MDREHRKTLKFVHDLHREFLKAHPTLHKTDNKKWIRVNEDFRKCISAIDERFYAWEYPKEGKY